MKYQANSKTSYAAAYKAQRDAATERAAVLACLDSHRSYGATDAEMQDELRMEGNTQRPRRVELVKLGFVYETAQRRLTPSRRKAVVWCSYKF